MQQEALEVKIGHGADVNITNRNITGLVLACMKRTIDAISLFLNEGADPNTADAVGDTPLIMQLKEVAARRPLRMICHSADVNVANTNNVTPLILACKKGNTDAINVLLSSVADPQIADADVTTSLHYAVESRSKDALEAIMNHGADVNAANKTNVTALILACKTGNTDAIDLFLGSRADCIADAESSTSLHHATEGGCYKETLQAIIDQGADANARCKINVIATDLGSFLEKPSHSFCYLLLFAHKSSHSHLKLNC